MRKLNISIGRLILVRYIPYRMVFIDKECINDLVPQNCFKPYLERDLLSLCLAEYEVEETECCTLV